MSTEITTADLLDEYARALRGSWGDIDGRSEQMSLNTLAEAIRRHGNDALPAGVAVGLRYELDVCPHGHKHWTSFCNDKCWATA